MEFNLRYLSSIEYKTLYEKELRETKKRLLVTYLFLNEKDLPDFCDDLSPKSWNNIFFLFFKQFSWKNLLSKEDFVVWETIINQKFQWYKDKRDLGLIDLTTFKIIESSEQK